MLGDLTEITVFPASHYVASDERMKQAVVGIDLDAKAGAAPVQGHDLLEPSFDADYLARLDLDPLLRPVRGTYHSGGRPESSGGGRSPTRRRVESLGLLGLSEAEVRGMKMLRDKAAAEKVDLP